MSYRFRQFADTAKSNKGIVIGIALLVALCCCLLICSSIIGGLTISLSGSEDTGYQGPLIDTGGGDYNAGTTGTGTTGSTGSLPTGGFGETSTGGTTEETGTTGTTGTNGDGSTQQSAPALEMFQNLVKNGMTPPEALDKMYKDGTLTKNLIEFLYKQGIIKDTGYNYYMSKL